MLFAEWAFRVVSLFNLLYSLFFQYAMPCAYFLDNHRFSLRWGCDGRVGCYSVNLRSTTDLVAVVSKIRSKIFFLGGGEGWGWGSSIID